MTTKNTSTTPPPVTLIGVLSALLVPVLVLAALGLVGGLLWNLAMPKLGYPAFSSLEALALWYLYLILICAPFVVCVGIWKAMTPPVIPQIYITHVPLDDGAPPTEKIMSNLTEALRSVAPPPDNPSTLADHKKEDNDDTFDDTKGD